MKWIALLALPLAMLGCGGGGSGGSGSGGDSSDRSSSAGFWAGEIGDGGLIEGVVDRSGAFDGYAAVKDSDEGYSYYAVTSDRLSSGWYAVRKGDGYGAQHESYNWTNTGISQWRNGRVTFNGRQTAEGKLSVEDSELLVTMVAKEPYRIEGSLSNTEWRATYEAVASWISTPDGRRPYTYRYHTLTIKFGRGGEASGIDRTSWSGPGTSGQVIERRLAGSIGDSGLSPDIKTVSLLYEDSEEEISGRLYLYSQGLSNREMTIVGYPTAIRLYEIY